MAIDLTPVTNAISAKLLSLDSSVSFADMRHYLAATSIIGASQYSDSAGLLPAADSDYKGQIALTMPASSADSGNGLWICDATSWTKFQDLDSA